MALIIASILVGAELIAYKFALREFTPLYINVFKFGFGSIVSVAIFYKRAIKIGKEYIKAGVFLGVLKFLGVALLTISLNYVSVAMNALLIASNVVWIPILSCIIYRQRLTLTSSFGAFFCMIGICFITLDSELGIGIGEALALIAAIIFSFSVLFT